MDADFIKSIGPAGEAPRRRQDRSPGRYLLKPGKLDPEEFEIIKRHCAFGKKIIQPIPQLDWLEIQKHTTMGADILMASRSSVLDMAARIALTHHERWDGNGYPLGLAGEDIPIEGRIVAVADTFDAAEQQSVYKEPFPSAISAWRSWRGTREEI